MRIRWRWLADGGAYSAAVDGVSMTALPHVNGGWCVYGMGGYVRIYHKHRDVAGRGVVAAVKAIWSGK